MSDDSIKRGAWLILAALGIGVVVLLILFLNKDNDEHLSMMHLTGTTVDDKSYCADFVADEEGDDKIKITITNCGDMRIVVKPKGEPKKGLEGKHQFTTTLKNGSSFSAKITSVRGDYFGGFNI